MSRIKAVRFDALITDIPAFTEWARLFAFRSELSELGFFAVPGAGHHRLPSAMEPTKYRAPDGTVILFAVLDMRSWSDPPRCFCCGELGHAANACPRGGTADPPQ